MLSTSTARNSPSEVIVSKYLRGREGSIAPRPVASLQRCDVQDDALVGVLLVKIDRSRGGDGVGVGVA
jgi:hypothetical protein